MSYIEIVPIGETDRKLLERIAPAISEALDMPANVSPSMPLIESAFNPTRRQYLSSALLERLERARHASAVCSLGVADVDMYAPRLSFVFGEAILLGRVAVISLVRLRPEFYGGPPDPRVLERRAVIEAVHEISHTLGLQHCPSKHCVMRFSNCIEHSNHKGFAFCERCARAVKGLLLAA